MGASSGRQESVPFVVHITFAASLAKISRNGQCSGPPE